MLRWEAVVLSFYFKKQNSRPIKKLSFFLTHQLSWWHFHYWFFRRRHGRVGMGRVIIHARIYLDFEGFNFCCHRWAPNHRGNIWTWIFDWPGIHSSTATLVCWKKPPGLFQPTALCGGHRLWWWSGTCWNFECHRPVFCDGCHAYQAQKPDQKVFPKGSVSHNSTLCSSECWKLAGHLFLSAVVVQSSWTPCTIGFISIKWWAWGRVGHLLMQIYQHIKEHTPRGQHLEETPDPFLGSSDTWHRDFMSLEGPHCNAEVYGQNPWNDSEIE